MIAFTYAFQRFSYIGAALLGSLVVAGVAAAWTGPPGAPTTCPSGTVGCDAPINTSATAQGKIGSLGIGTLSPFGKLTVEGAGGTAYTSADFVVRNSVTPGKGLYMWYNNTNDVSHIQSVNYGVAYKNLALQWDGGNAGIGSLNPFYKLVVSNSGAEGLEVGPGYIAGRTLVQSFDRSTSVYTTIDFSASLFRFLISGVEKMSLNSSGNLIVNSGSVTANAFYYSSDGRLKENVASIRLDTALAQVLALRPVTYTWKDASKGTAPQLGFIAQEVEAVAPQLVTIDEATKLKAVDYARVAPLLVGAIQEQEKKIADQQKQIDELKAAVDALRADK